MNDAPSWQYDEFQQIGKDYDSAAEVEAYDLRHGKFRDVRKENEAILDALAVLPGQEAIEFGTGTGAFAIQAAGHFRRVYAVDISPAMLEYAGSKARTAGAGNVAFRRGGFLTYCHEGPQADAIVTNTALHHLPDLWKAVALKRLNGMLKPGGVLYLSDVIFEERNLRENIELFIGNLEKVAGPELRADVESHIRQEYSTYDWIMDGLLERAGFRIESKVVQGGVIGRYLCRKGSAGAAVQPAGIGAVPGGGA